jgi:hypothetical protein
LRAASAAAVLTGRNVPTLSSVRTDASSACEVTVVIRAGGTCLLPALEADLPGYPWIGDLECAAGHRLFQHSDEAQSITFQSLRVREMRTQYVFGLAVWFWMGAVGHSGGAMLARHYNPATLLARADGTIELYR